ncbi:unnamed protein product [Lactuca saligna]|uniref:3-ketoacyl-CoA synthase n=1 Tax=Lactuca saligna TaxID=75948 RepID=A0AA35V1P8_LACSI|nr:unnamed protein product [Lactuca saligna]
MAFLTTIMILFTISYICLWLTKLVSKRGETCYMIDYECYKATKDTMLDTEQCTKIASRNKNLGIEDYRFLAKTMVSSGIGEETYGPKCIILGEEEHPKLADSLSELESVFYDTLDRIFARSKISPSQVDILVVNVSLLSTVPSLTSRIINHYKMRSDIKAFNLIGMGCSASLVAIDLVQHLFKTQKKKIAIVVSTEAMSAHWYCGRERSMMLSNCLFRVGGCSMLLTNDRARKNQSILKLKCMVRTHLASDDEAYNCCMQVEDDEGYQGFRLNKTLTKVAARALSKNLRVLLPKVLPLWEIIRYVLLKSRSKINLKTGIEHFCIHPGGRAVIDDVGESLGLSEYDLEPARMALHRFGNTSSGGLWYVLGYMEAKKRLKKGDRMLMISLGAGFKSNTCVWEVTRDLDRTNVWKDIIENYPPKKTINPYIAKYAWIHDKDMDFVTTDDIKMMLIGSAA